MLREFRNHPEIFSNHPLKLIGAIIEGHITDYLCKFGEIYMHQSGHNTDHLKHQELLL